MLSHMLKLMLLIVLAGALPAGEALPPSVSPGPTEPAPAVTSPNATISVPVSTAPARIVMEMPTARPTLKRETLGDYTLAWSDEFNGDTLDTKLWECRTDSKYWSIGKEANVTVSNGFLHVALKKEKAGKLDYTAGGIVSKRNFRYGFYEASVKCPPGKGWHTTFALTAYKSEVTGNRQEIDVFENDSIEPKAFNIALQQWKPTHRVFDSKKGVKAPGDLSQDFHVWGCEFTPQKVRYFVDGEQVASYDAKEIIHDDQSIWIYCFAAPLQRTLHVEDDKLPAEVQIDWVRFYEKPKQ